MEEIDYSSFPIFDDYQVVKDLLTRDPVSFLIVGKPGCGKSMLAELLSSSWKCVHINDTMVLKEALQEQTALGKKAKDILYSGDALTDSLVLQMIAKKLNSSSIQHYGYVLDCLPALSDNRVDIDEQLSFVKKLGPTIIINLKISDQDLEWRRVNRSVNLFSKDVRTSVIDPLNNNEVKEEDSEVEKSEGEEEEDRKKKESSIFDPEIVAFPTHKSTLRQAVQNPEDVLRNVRDELDRFRTCILQSLEDIIVGHNRQYLIELDANLLPKELFKSVMTALDHRGLSRCPVPITILDENYFGDDIDSLDTDEFLKELSDINTIFPKFNWRRSKWGRYCPVQLSEGNLVHGKKDFSVGFLGDIYCLSSAESLKKFMINPRPYLLPPYPVIPCKICIVGLPTSGKSTLALALAQHFGAMVLDVEQMLIPKIEEEKDRLCEKAKQEAQSAAMDQLVLLQVDSLGVAAKDHPDVVKAVEDAVMFAKATLEVTEEMYLTVIKLGIANAEMKRVKTGSDTCFGGWILDGFPKTRDHWEILLDNDILPDLVICLDDHLAPENYLFSRFTKFHSLSEESIGSAANEDEPKKESDLAAEEVKLLEQWKKSKTELDLHLSQLITSAKGSGIYPHIVNCSLPMDKIASDAIQFLEEIFTVKPLDVDYDAEDEDDPNPSDEDVSVDTEEMTRQMKPWGDSHHFCPVALKESNVLWPGSKDFALRYKEKLYCFSSEEAKEKFYINPLKYVATSHMLKLPPVRIFILGAKSSGKTTIGRKFASKYDIFHISFREYLQEEILPKLVQPPLVDDDEWEGADELPNTKESLTNEEIEINLYLANGDPLSDATLRKFTEPFWMEEPFKSTGFILEGFPSRPDEMEFLCINGFFPDAVVLLQVEEDDVIRRTVPSRLAVWKKKRNIRLLKRKQYMTMMISDWEHDKELRKADLKAEYLEKVAAIASKSSSNEDEDEVDQINEELQEMFAEIDEEELPEFDIDEEEESESEAIDRMKGSLADKYADEMELILQVQETCAEFRVPYHLVNASKMQAVVEFSLEKTLFPYICDRHGLLVKCTSVDADLAKVLLDTGYKVLSAFQKWCPVKSLESSYNVLPPMSWKKAQQFPVIYRQYVYYLSSPDRKKLFMANPLKYLLQKPPGPAHLVILSIVGPPKSGKTTVAKRFCQEYGCVRLSIGEVVRRQINKFPDSQLTSIIQSHLRVGEVVPDDICALALESVLLDVQCFTRGYVLDGWPLTKIQVDMLSKCHIIPVCILELTVTKTEILRRAKKDRVSFDGSNPVHDSDVILTAQSKYYYESVKQVKGWYSSEYGNWHTIDGARSTWWVWKQCNEYALYTANQIQQYMSRAPAGQVASIHGLCVTPLEFKTSLGEFSDYCPVDLALRGELVVCSGDSLQFAVEYRQKYYKMCSKDDLELFLANPDSFVYPNAPFSLPGASLLPKKISEIDVKALFPKQYAIRGFCPVCHILGGECYETLIPGSAENSAEYDGKIYCFCSEEHLEKFLRKPTNFVVLKLPSKLPPLKVATPLKTLPILGYMEQAVSAAVIDSLGAVGLLKPKYPFISSINSALLYIGLYLKAFNLQSNQYVRQKYKKKLIDFKDKCELIDYLSSKMQPGYQEPLQRHISFNHKMNLFLNLKSSASLYEH